MSSQVILRQFININDHFSLKKKEYEQKDTKMK